jgi:hypothetical protein
MSISNLENNNLAPSGVSGTLTTDIIGFGGGPTPPVEITLKWRIRDMWVDVELPEIVFNLPAPGFIETVIPLPEFIRPASRHTTLCRVTSTVGTPERVGQCWVEESGILRFYLTVTGSFFGAGANDIKRQVLRYCLSPNN